MKRVALTEDGIKTGQYFDADIAEYFKEEAFWNGHNQISKITGSQWDHETLWLTVSGKWILNRYSQYEGRGETYEIITPEDAAEWLVKNEYKDDMIPEGLKGMIANLEI